jgi:hypothetical protein
MKRTMRRPFIRDRVALIERMRYANVRLVKFGFTMRDVMQNNALLQRQFRKVTP